jgi:4-amino-4-deoxy-L-arabinose transferase-like glycosyltransferase
MRKRFAEPLLVASVATLTNFLYYAFTLRDYLFPDSITYLVPARNLLRGLGFVDAAGAAETLRTPGYPLLLAAFGGRIVWVVVAQHLMNVAIAVAIYLVAAPRLGRFIALTAALLFAIDTPSVHYANKILSETLFTLLLLAVFGMVVAGRQLPAAGLLTGALVLVRPVAIAYFIIVAAYLLLRRVRVRHVVIYVLLAVALPFGWALRNLARSGVLTVSSIGGTNLLLFRAGGTLAILDGGEDFEADRREEAEGLLGDADAAIERTLHTDAEELPHAVRARYYSRYALQIIRQHPLAFTELTLRGLMVNLLDSRSDAMTGVSPFHESVVRLGLDAYTVALCLFALIGAFVLRRDELGVFAILTVGYFLLISAGGEAEARFRVPVVPQYAILAAAGVDAVRRVAARQPR